MNPLDPAGPAGGAPVCSAKGCRADALHLVHWRNPRIHGPERRKTWAACDSHVTTLSGFLRARSFPVEVSPLPSGEG